MIVGNPSVFAIESGLTVAYENLSLLGLGFFVIHVGGYCYGVRTPDATCLGLPFEGVGRCLAERGIHTAPFSSLPDAGKIADAFRNAFYADKQDQSFFDLNLSEFEILVHCNQLDWTSLYADEAFNDGSYVLHFDLDDRVRLIGYKSEDTGYRHAPATLRDVWLSGDDFYAILQNWHDAFEAELNSAPKES